MRVRNHSLNESDGGLQSRFRFWRQTGDKRFPQLNDKLATIWKGYLYWWRHCSCSLISCGQICFTQKEKKTGSLWQSDLYLDVGATEESGVVWDKYWWQKNPSLHPLAQFATESVWENYLIKVTEDIAWDYDMLFFKIEVECFSTKKNGTTKWEVPKNFELNKNNREPWPSKELFKESLRNVEATLSGLKILSL